jgi:ATP-binding cassette, subfamily B, bacterial MsbA
VINRIVGVEVKSAASRATMPALIDLMTGLGFFAVLMIGGREIIQGTRTVGDFMSFFSAMTLAFQPVRRLGDVAGSWQTAAASLERIYRLFDTESALKVVPDAPLFRPADTTIRVQDVHLSYDAHPVLNGLTFTAEAGKTTAIVGPSGAGKSTVFNLLTRLVDPASGLITIGGTDISRTDLGSLRDLFSVVSQDGALFDETIRENIILGHTDIPAARIEAAADAAHVTDFVRFLPNRLDSLAGPRGSSLSGGQRQRVAIARAVLRDAPVLLLDEATSALDAASEAVVQEALENLSKGRTTLVIAHRLATVRKADKIIVMEKGRVVEEGTHETLVNGNGLYASLCRLQFPDLDTETAEGSVP